MMVGQTENEVYSDIKRIAQGILDGTFGVTSVSRTASIRGKQEYTITGFELPTMFNKKPEPKLEREYHCSVKYDFSKSNIAFKDYVLIKEGLRTGELIHINYGTGMNGDNDIDETVIIQDTLVCSDGAGYPLSKETLAKFVERYGNYRIVRVDQLGRKS